MDQRSRGTGSRSLIYSSTRLVRAASLCPARGRTAARPPRRVRRAVAEAWAVAAGAFVGVQTAVSGDAARAIEARDGLEGVTHGESGEQADAGMGAQASDAQVVLSARFEGLLNGVHLLSQGSEQREGMLALDREGPGEEQGGG